MFLQGALAQGWTEGVREDGSLLLAFLGGFVNITDAFIGGVLRGL